MCRKREPRDDSYQSCNSSKLILFITGTTGPFGRVYDWVVDGAETSLCSHKVVLVATRVSKKREQLAIALDWIVDFESFEGPPDKKPISGYSWAPASVF